MHEVRELNRRNMDQDVVFIQRANLPKRDGGCDVLVT